MDATPAKVAALIPTEKLAVLAVAKVKSRMTYDARKMQAQRVFDWTNQRVYETLRARGMRNLPPPDLILIGEEIRLAFMLCADSILMAPLQPGFKIQEIPTERAVDGDPMSLRFMVELPHEIAP